jgi:hypothetical protein
MSTVIETRKKDKKKKRLQLFESFSKSSSDVFMGDGCGARDNCGPVGGCTCDIEPDPDWRHDCGFFVSKK